MALCIDIKVIPLSGRQRLLVDKSGQLKCFIKSAPQKGKANKECIEVIAKCLGIAKGSIEIVAGFTSRKKLCKLHIDMTYEQILDLLGSGSQQSIIK